MCWQNTEDNYRDDYKVLKTLNVHGIIHPYLQLLLINGLNSMAVFYFYFWHLVLQPLQRCFIRCIWKFREMRNIETHQLCSKTLPIMYKLCSKFILLFWWMNSSCMIEAQTIKLCLLKCISHKRSIYSIRPVSSLIVLL